MSVPLRLLMGLQSVAVARVGLDGTLLEANNAFRRLAEVDDGGVADRFIEPPFRILVEAEEGDAREGLLNVGRRGAVARSLRGLVMRGTAELLVVLEEDRPSLERLAEEVVVLNGELNDLYREQVRTTQRLRQTQTSLEEALAQVRTLRGLLPICAACKKIRDEEGKWVHLETYLQAHSEAEFTHGVCRECMARDLAELDEQARGG